ncbi:hypothetical protein BIV24_14030 [Streptomyces colonosanans]|uniref:Uncharacterized protein n=1 Tax=Streptomyces colonosanans TaxID=1428652 RepID=A0A1S2PDU0_9ACTN|nr:hypothetical protein BIV24_14030 [Streptomyces colonosanans]
MARGPYPWRTGRKSAAGKFAGEFAAALSGARAVRPGMPAAGVRVTLVPLILPPEHGRGSPA